MSGLDVSISQLTGMLFRGLHVANSAHVEHSAQKCIKECFHKWQSARLVATVAGTIAAPGHEQGLS
jgi:hypothetical protein